MRKRPGPRRVLRKPPLSKLIAWSAFLCVVLIYLVSLVAPVSIGTNGWGVTISLGNVSILQESSVSGGSAKQEWKVGGFGCRRASNWEAGQHGFAGANVYHVPVWFPLLMAAAPVLWLAARHRPLAPLSICSSCEYDCTGVPEAVPCPECGKARAEEARS